MKKRFLILILTIVATLSFVFTACGVKFDDGEWDEDGNYRPSSGVTQINFWGHSDEVEYEVFMRLVNEFNRINDGKIKVNYEPKASDGYSDALGLALIGNRPPDVFYVGDKQYKSLADQELLLPLDNYIFGKGTAGEEGFIPKSKDVVPSEMWANSIDRYRYDLATTTFDGPDAQYWGVPKDIGPTVTFYNEDFFTGANIKILSVAKEDLDDFNNGEPDARGKTKAQLGISGTVGEYGYFVDAANQKWFNNQIPMSFEETVECSLVIQKSKGESDGTPNTYGFFTEWWFNFGWSVGGDCIEYVSSDASTLNGGFWEFTLMDPSKNYIVADGKADFTINGKTYSEGQIISWQDKLAALPTVSSWNESSNVDLTIHPSVLSAVSSGQLWELPSQREAFVEFVRFGQKTSQTVDNNLKGYGISPSPLSIGGDSGKVTAFTNGQIAMVILGRWHVPDLRKRMENRKYDWDVAPLPIYRDYSNDDGQFSINRTVKARGIESGHSGSVALSIAKESRYPNAAWKFVEYIGGRIGQEEQAKSGFAIPTQIDLAHTDIFLQSDQKPRNSMAFVRAAAVQTPGDWWYLFDDAWINPWALLLNGKVRNNDMTLTEFENHADYKSTNLTLRSYTRKR